MKDRVYVCHTFYHIYVSFLKEMYLPKEKQGKATLIISHMSTDFGNFPDRVRQACFFEDVIDFDEKSEDFFPELARYRKPCTNLIKNIYNRIIFTRKYAKLEEPYIPVDFRQFKEIYVFCDSDPIGYYLNYKHIYYHAIEDGLNCISHGDLAHYDNRGHFGLKAFLSQKCNLIFIQNGYSKYCIDMEVNDISAIEIPFEKYVELKRSVLVEHLTKEDKELLLKVFVKDIEELRRLALDANKKTVMILTEPLCSLDVRRELFQDIMDSYRDEYNILLKPHPRDELDYATEFPGICIIEKTVPMEMLNFIEGCEIDVVVGVFTELGAIQFAKEKVRLGCDFMDKYEEPAKHRQPEAIREAMGLKQKKTDRA